MGVQTISKKKKTMKSISDSFHIGDSSVCFPTLSSNDPILSGH